MPRCCPVPVDTKQYDSASCPPIYNPYVPGFGFGLPLAFPWAACTPGDLTNCGYDISSFFSTTRHSILSTRYSPPTAHSARAAHPVRSAAPPAPASAPGSYSALPTHQPTPPTQLIARWRVRWTHRPQHRQLHRLDRFRRDLLPLRRQLRRYRLLQLRIDPLRKLLLQRRLHDLLWCRHLSRARCR